MSASESTGFAGRKNEAAKDGALKRIARGAELQAHVMRDALRTGGWAGAEKVAEAFDDIAERAREALKGDAS